MGEKNRLTLPAVFNVHLLPPTTDRPISGCVLNIACEFFKPESALNQTVFLTLEFAVLTTDLNMHRNRGTISNMYRSAYNGAVH